MFHLCKNVIKINFLFLAVTSTAKANEGECPYPADKDLNDELDEMMNESLAVNGYQLQMHEKSEDEDEETESEREEDPIESDREAHPKRPTSAPRNKKDDSKDESLIDSSDDNEKEELLYRDDDFFSSDSSTSESEDEGKQERSESEEEKEKRNHSQSESESESENEKEKEGGNNEEQEDKEKQEKKKKEFERPIYPFSRSQTDGFIVKNIQNKNQQRPQSASAEIPAEMNKDSLMKQTEELPKDKSPKALDERKKSFERPIYPYSRSQTDGFILKTNQDENEQRPQSAIAEMSSEMSSEMDEESLTKQTEKTAKDESPKDLEEKRKHFERPIYPFSRSQTDAFIIKDFNEDNTTRPQSAKAKIPSEKVEEESIKKNNNDKDNSQQEKEKSFGRPIFPYSRSQTDNFVTKTCNDKNDKRPKSASAEISSDKTEENLKKKIKSDNKTKQSFDRPIYPYNRTQTDGGILMNKEPKKVSRPKSSSGNIPSGIERKKDFPQFKGNPVERRHTELPISENKDTLQRPSSSAAAISLEKKRKKSQKHVMFQARPISRSMTHENNDRIHTDNDRRPNTSAGDSYNPRSPLPEKEENKPLDLFERDISFTKARTMNFESEKATPDDNRPASSPPKSFYQNENSPMIDIPEDSNSNKHHEKLSRGATLPPLRAISALQDMDDRPPSSGRPPSAPTNRMIYNPQNTYGQFISNILQRAYTEVLKSSRNEL